MADLEHLASLFDQYRQFQGKPGDLAAARSFLHDRFNHGESVMFIAFDGELPVEFAQLYPSFSSVTLSRVFILNDLFVAESGRRRGVASEAESFLGRARAARQKVADLGAERSRWFPPRR